MVGGIDAGDFTNFGLDDFGVTVSRTTITKTLDNITGREILTSGTPANITATMAIGELDFRQLEALKLEFIPSGVICVAQATTLNEQDLVTYDGKTYEVKNIIEIDAGGTGILKKGYLLLKS